MAYRALANPSETDIPVESDGFNFQELVSRRDGQQRLRDNRHAIDGVGSALLHVASTDGSIAARLVVYGFFRSHPRRRVPA